MQQYGHGKYILK